MEKELKDRINKLIQDYSDLPEGKQILKIILDYAKLPEIIEDSIQVGFETYLSKLKTYDPSRGTTPVQYCEQAIRGAVIKIYYEYQKKNMTYIGNRSVKSINEEYEEAEKENAPKKLVYANFEEVNIVTKKINEPDTRLEAKKIAEAINKLPP